MPSLAFSSFSAQNPPSVASVFFAGSIQFGSDSLLRYLSWLLFINSRPARPTEFWSFFCAKPSLRRLRLLCELNPVWLRLAAPLLGVYPPWRVGSCSSIPDRRVPLSFGRFSAQIQATSK